jgi:(2Fe-2S) ferredoxin
MNFLKRLFGGGGEKADRALYFYVRPKMCREIVQVRIDLLNQLSRTEDESGFFVRKEARAVRCPFPAEIQVTFDSSYRIVAQEITNGEFVTEADYQAFVAGQKPNPTS